MRRSIRLLVIASARALLCQTRKRMPCSMLGGGAFDTKQRIILLFLFQFDFHILLRAAQSLLPFFFSRLFGVLLLGVIIIIAFIDYHLLLFVKVNLFACPHFIPTFSLSFAGLLTPTVLVFITTANNLKPFP